MKPVLVSHTSAVWIHWCFQDYDLAPLRPLQEIVAIVAAELAQQNSLEQAAQCAVERVRRLHHDAFASGRQRGPHCSRHEDMTLVVRTLSYALPDSALTPTQGKAMSGVHPASGFWLPLLLLAETKCFPVCVCVWPLGGRIYPVSVPYSNSQSTSKTSVTLSLVMPSQGTLTNGTNTASTLDGGTPTGYSPCRHVCLAWPSCNSFVISVYMNHKVVVVPTAKHIC